MNHNTVDCKPLYTALRMIYFDDKDKEYKEEGNMTDPGGPGLVNTREQDS